MLKTWRKNFEWEGGGRSVLYLTDLWSGAIWSKKGRFFVGVSQHFCNWLLLALQPAHANQLAYCDCLLLMPCVIRTRNVSPWSHSPSYAQTISDSFCAGTKIIPDFCSDVGAISATDRWSEAMPHRSRKWSVTYWIGCVPHLSVVWTGIRTVAEVNK